MSVKVDVNLTKIQSGMAHLADKQTMLQIHNLYAKFLNPYVPMDEGILSQNLTITPDYVQYNVPYAHYMYEGVVYGPNIPIEENGVIVGYWSKPGVAKHPTGKNINYSHEKHSLASRHWDKKAMDDKGEVFIKDVAEILKKKLSGG